MILIGGVLQYRPDLRENTVTADYGQHNILSVDAGTSVMMAGNGGGSFGSPEKKWWMGGLQRRAGESWTV